MRDVNDEEQEGKKHAQHNNKKKNSTMGNTKSIEFK